MNVGAVVFVALSLVACGDSAPATADAGADALSADGASADAAPSPLAFMPPLHDFGTLARDAVDTTMFTLGNMGSVVVDPPDVKVTGDAGSFEIVANTCQSALAPGATCLLEVAFNAQQVGAHEAVITARVVTGTATATVRGVVVAP